MKSIILVVAVLSSLGLNAQRKMPAISFLENSLEFADANKSFSEVGQLTDTLRDDQIVKALIKILVDNDNLQIELAGHCAGNEDTLISQQRADLVKQMLVDGGISSSRIDSKGYGFKEPVITNQILLSLSSRAERDEANLRNRRVEIKVVGVKPE